MKRLIIIGLIALVLTSCVIQVGHGYYDEDLSYYNEAMLYQVCDLGQLEVSVSGAEIELEGSDDEIIDLVVGFNECRPGDAGIYIENGKIKARSISGKQVSITKIEGEIPQWLNLKISNTSGNVSVEDSEAAELDIQVGSGNVLLIDNSAYEAKIRAGSGNVYLEDSEINSIDIQVGSGNITFKDCELDYGSVTTGSGDIILKDSDYYDVDFKVGSGVIRHLR